MSKKTVHITEKITEETKELAKEPLPEITFAEAEVQKVADFINWVFQNGTYAMKLGDMKKVSGMLNDMHAHVSKIEKYIFEHRRVIAAKKAVGAVE